MAIVRDGAIQCTNFGQLKLIYQDIARYLTTGHIPGWALELEKYGIPRERVMDEVFFQIADITAARLEYYKRELAEERKAKAGADPELF